MHQEQREERRAEPRRPASLLVTYASESLALSGIATDLSPSGLFLETELLDTVGTEAFLRLSDGARRRVEAVGRVVRTTCEPGVGTPGMGLQFVELGAEAIFWIRRYCNAFSSSLRVALMDSEIEHVDFASRAVESIGARPLCLSPEVVSLTAVARLDPHVVILGSTVGRVDGVALAEALLGHPQLHSTTIYLAGDIDMARLEEAARRVGVAGALSWRDDRAILEAVDEASRRLGRGPALPKSGHFWLN